VPSRETIRPHQIKLHKQSRSHVQYIQHLLCLSWTAISKQDSSPSSPYISRKVNGPKNFIVLPDTFVEEVNMVINNLLVSKSNIKKDIRTHIPKLCKNSLSPFLVQIFNLCIKEGTYPQSLKCTQVVPIYKGGPKDLCTNYRPISLLSPTNKIFEKLTYSRLYT